MCYDAYYADLLSSYSDVCSTVVRLLRSEIVGSIPGGYKFSYLNTCNDKVIEREIMCFFVHPSSTTKQ